MDFFKILFPVAGIETYFFFPPLVAFAISYFTSMGGISGAFLILPFQMSVLGFTTPAVSATNLLYNVVGTPGGVTRYAGEKRMLWPLAGCIISGTLPGVWVGYYLRVKYLPDPKLFKFFVGIVLLLIGMRLIYSAFQNKSSTNPERTGSFDIGRITCQFPRIFYNFRGSTYSFTIATVSIFALLVGIVGGIYGVGGGAILAPFCVSILNLPIYTVAGAILLGNFMTSLAGVIFYSAIPLHNGAAASPDWLLGLLLGIGGLTGMYVGARSQIHFPERLIKLILASIILFISTKYILGFILSP